MQSDEIKNIDIPNLSAKDIKNDLKDAFKEVFVDGHHVATMTKYDYNAYNKAFPTTVEKEALELYLNEKDALLAKYPNKSIESIIGFVLSQKLYNEETL